MAGIVEDRIERRKAVAQEQMQKENSVQRFFSRIGLAVADGIDRTESPLDNSMAAFGIGFGEGALRGAFVCAVLIGLPLFMFTSMGAVGLLGIAAAGAGVVGLYHGVKGARDHQRHMHDKHLADRIAEKSGAVPLQTPEHSTDTHSKANFVAREKARRAQAQSNQL